jgi:RNA polymerase sigma-70 factor (ECF subfamily)
MEVTLAPDSDLTFDAVARQEWLARCEAAYATVYRGLVAVGATRDEAADALQDAFEEALRQKTQVTRPEGWLFVVAHRRWRRARWRRRLFRPLERAQVSIGNDRDEAIDLLTELGRLTERQRTVIVSRYVLGLSQREIADLLGIAPGTVAATVHQVTTLLRERLIGGTK